MPMHDDELLIDDALVHRLVGRDAPTLAERPLRRLEASGSSNVLYRLGDDHLVRLPRQPGGSDAIDIESTWLPVLASQLPVAVPEVVAVGEAGFGYPERWSIVRWLDGVTPAAPGSGTLAADLAEFVAALRSLAVPPDAAADPRLRGYRAGPLADADAEVRGYLAACEQLPDLGLDLGACRELWYAATGLPAYTGVPRWVHADLLAENLLVRAGRLAAVLDFGALAVGDPSVDLIVAWEVLGPAQRDQFRAHLDVDDATWLRGRAWALAIAIMTFPYYWSTMPERCAARLAMAQQVLDDASSAR